MAASDEDQTPFIPPPPFPDSIEEDEDTSDDVFDEPPHTRQSKLELERDNLKTLINKISNETITLRVHDVIIKGNTKTKDSLIEACMEDVKGVESMQELLKAVSVSNMKLRELGIFDGVTVTLDSGPKELSGTANVVVEVVEAGNPVTGNIGVFTKPEARSWSLESQLKLKNPLGRGDIWDFSLGYGWDQTSDISCGISLPRFKRLADPVTARVSVLTQDWLKYSSYKERLLGLSVGLFSSRNHDLAYNLTWRNLIDPSQISSRSIRTQLGHSLLSSIKYMYKVDHRDSQVRPTRGYAFASTSHIGGLAPDSRSLRFLRQDFDFRYALPLGFLNAALNFGLSAGVIFPWGSGFKSKQNPLPERFFIGGHSSPMCTLGGPTSLLGFKTRGLGPNEPRRLIVEKFTESSDMSPGRDFIGGDLAVTAFADLSFNLPLKLFRDAGVHAHLFAGAGNLTKLTENEYRNFSFQKFGESFRSSVGAGIIVPTPIFRMEVNYCYIVKQLEHDRGKTGLQFSFSAAL